MKAKEIIAQKGFWKSVFFLSIMFIVVYNFIDLWMSFRFNFDAYCEEKLSAERWLIFVVANLIGGFLYGFIIIYLNFRLRLKREKKQSS